MGDPGTAFIFAIRWLFMLFSSHQSFEYLKMDVELQISKDSLAQLVSAAGARETPLDVSTPEACTLAQVHSTECWGGIKKDLNKAGNPKSIVLAALSQPRSEDFLNEYISQFGGSMDLFFPTIGSWGREIPWFQGNLGWWNTIIYIGQMKWWALGSFLLIRRD